MAGEAEVLAVADLATGLALLLSAAFAIRRSRAAGVLIAATSVLWFTGNWFALALFWHRATLIHVLLAFPGWWPRSLPARVVLVAGYGTSVLAPSFWLNDVRGVFAAAVVTLAAGWALHGSRGPTRHERRFAFAAALVLGADLVISGAVRRLMPAEDNIIFRLLTYDGAVAAAALILAAGLRSPRAHELTDLVVDLGDGPGAACATAWPRCYTIPTCGSATGRPSPATTETSTVTL